MKLKTVCGCFAMTTALLVACGDDGDEDSFDGGGSGGTTSGKGGTASGKGGTTSGKGGSQGSSAGAEAGGDGNVGEAGAPAGGTPSAGGANGSAGSDGEAGAGVGGAANCPDVFGIYTITSAEGTCGDFDDQVDQELAGTDVTCFLHFVSVGALNGGADLDENGEFSDAQLYVGTDQRNPCAAEYDAGEGSMVVSCGGVGDACTITLERQ